MKFLFALCILLGVQSFGQTLQILHTNDLHSYWENDMTRERGGYARIKALMDQLEAEGNKRHWVTIRLDAGDFSDGHINFLAKRGSLSFEIMKLMGYDAIALGNHDYVTGVEPLVERANEADTALPIVAANFSFRHAAGILPGRIIYRGGLKIAVGGSTTDDVFYKWRAFPALIGSPELALEDWLSQQHADIRIALTHVGLADDIQYVNHSRAADVVIGGHSHHTMRDAQFALNLDHHIVPVVQAGYHGRYLGQTVIELPVGSSTRVVHYQLHPITLDMPEDPQVKAKVQEGAAAIRLEPTAQNLDKPVAYSTGVRFVYLHHNSYLSNFIGDALREFAQADVALDIGSLYGPGLPKGELTVKDIYNMQPHTYDVREPGWTALIAQVSGANLKKLIGLASWSGFSFIVSGLEAHLNGLHRVEWMKIGGKPVSENKLYSVITSQGTLQASPFIPQFAKLFPPPYVNTGVLVRDILLEKAKAIKVFDGGVTGDIRVSWPGSEKPVHNRTCGECIGN